MCYSIANVYLLSKTKRINIQTLIHIKIHTIIFVIFTTLIQEIQTTYSIHLLKKRKLHPKVTPKTITFF